MKVGMERSSFGIHPVKLLFAIFLLRRKHIKDNWNKLRTQQNNMRVCETYIFVKGRLERELKEPVNWLFCAWLKFFLKVSLEFFGHIKPIIKQWVVINIGSQCRNVRQWTDGIR